ncbi:MAG: anion transporter [Dehalococcoidia bacterium]|nr:anion transporter [Dehalococcoidia bacterium]
MALAIFVATFLGVSLTRVPWVALERPVVAFLGAVAMVLSGALSPQAAAAAIHWDTISLLLGMMLVIAGLQRDGYTQALARASLGRAGSPRQLLVVVVVVTGVASAFLVNDAVVLVFTPILVAHCRSRGLNPVPFLLAEAMASNIGGVATITGNPQNMMVGLHSGISYPEFLALLLPVAVLSSLVLVLSVGWLYRKDLRKPHANAERTEIPPNPPLPKGGTFPPPFTKGGLGGFPRSSLLILALVLLGFLLTRWTGVGVPLVALAGAGLVLAVGGHSPRDLFAQVDWVLLLFFASLFVVIGGLVQAGGLAPVIDAVPVRQDLGGMVLIHGVSLVLSQLISNVPYTALMLPVLQPQDSELLWLSLASAATLAGNLTLIGAVANLIVAEQAKRDGVVITFGQFLRLGLPVTLLSLLISLLVLSGEHALGWLG